MKIKIQQFLFGKSHSWAHVGQNLGRELIKLGHEVHFISTDGFDDKYCPADLKPYVVNSIAQNEQYDCQISYTQPHNWPQYLSHGKKNKFAIWNYEYNSKQSTSFNLLEGYGKYHNFTNKLLPSSTFSKKVFLNMGIPSDKMVVVPHGINLDHYKSDEVFKLNTKKTKKILLNIAQPHKRKAIHLALEAYGKAFSKGDDVCLVAKVLTANKNDQIFNVDFHEILKSFKAKFPNHAEIEIVSKFIPNIVSMYNACDINFSATHAECWHLPSLEALAANKINVVPNYGGQLDFCSDLNSLLISGKETRAPRDHQYWTYNSMGVHFTIDTDDAATKLVEAVKNYDSLKEKFLPYMKSTAEKFTWENAAKQILELCE